jgi:glycerol-3-phosphate responsive antiterminator
MLVDELPKEILKLDSLINDVQQVKTNTNFLTLEDKEFLKVELVEVISTMKHVVRFMEEQYTKVGTKPSEFESFAMVSEKLLNAIKELRVLNMDILNSTLAQKRLQQALEIKTGNTTNNVQNNVYMLDSKSLDDMIKNAEKNRRIDSIEVDFETDSQIK